MHFFPIQDNKVTDVVAFNCKFNMNFFLFILDWNNMKLYAHKVCCSCLLHDKNPYLMIYLQNEFDLFCI